MSGDLADWLTEVQRDLGITYTEDDAEQRLRDVFEMIRTVLPGCSTSVHYFGFLERQQEDGSRVRRNLMTLEAEIVAADKRSYHLTLTGPYGPLSEAS